MVLCDRLEASLTAVDDTRRVRAGGSGIIGGGQRYGRSPTLCCSIAKLKDEAARSFNLLQGGSVSAGRPSWSQEAWVRRRHLFRIGEPKSIGRSASAEPTSSGDRSLSSGEESSLPLANSPTRFQRWPLNLPPNTVRAMDIGISQRRAELAA